jgi:TetR/AcrR family transcriptional regulator
VSSIPTALPIATDSAGARRERRKEARPGELLAAALDLFVEKGFAGARAEEVAQRAGVSKGTLFLYFPTKEDSTSELIPYLMHMWWERFGSTKASGLSKLMMSEATNFPELANFYYAEVIEPNHRLVRTVIQRGIDRGEFRQVDVEYASYSVLAPMIYLVNWKHSMGCCISPNMQIDPVRYLKTQADMVVHALLATSEPLPS